MDYIARCRTDESQRDELVKNLTVISDSGGVIELLEAHRRVEPGDARSQVCRGGVASCYFNGQHQFQELPVAEISGLG